MKAPKAVLGTGIAAAALAATTLAGAGTARADSTTETCPEGWVCIFGPDVPSTSYPQGLRFGHGVHDLDSLSGWHWVISNLAAGENLSMCRGYGGVDCWDVFTRGSYVVDFTTVRSLVIT